MKAPRKKVPYKKEGKRNPMLNVATVAGRRAKNRAAEKDSEERLRIALGNPTSPKGQHIPGHLLKTIAAERLSAVDVSRPATVFEFAAHDFLKTLKYSWGCAPTINSLWKTFLDLVESGDSDMGREFARNYATAFRWCVVGHVHRLEREYESLPHSLVLIEIYQGKNGHFSVGVQRDGERRVMHTDRPPESPTIALAGSKTHHFIAPKDLKTMRRIGYDRFLDELKSGKRESSPSPPFLIVEDTLLNVAAPSGDELDASRRDMRFMLTSLHYKPKPRTKSKP